MGHLATSSVADEHRSAERALTDRWYIEATRTAADSVEAVDLIARHNKHRKTIDIDLRRVAIDGNFEKFTVRLLARERDATSLALHRVPCARYSAKQLDAAMALGRAKLDELIRISDGNVAEIFRDEPHYS